MLTGVLIVVAFYTCLLGWLFVPGRIRIVQLDDGLWYVRRRWNGVYHKCLSRTEDYWWLEYKYHMLHASFRTKEQAIQRLKEYTT